MDKTIYELGRKFFELRIKFLDEQGIPTNKLENVEFGEWIHPLRSMIENGYSSEQIEKIIDILKSSKNHEFWRNTVKDTKSLAKNAESILRKDSGKNSDYKFQKNDTINQKLKSYE